MKLVDIQKLLSLPVDYSDRQDRLYRLVFPMFLALGYNPYDKRAFVVKENLDIAVYKGVQVVLRIVLKDNSKTNLGSGLTCITDGKVYNIYLGKKLRCSFNAEKATEEDFQDFKNKLGYDNIEAYWDKAELEVVYGDQINYVGDLNFRNNIPKTKASSSLIDKSSKVTRNVELVLDNISKFDESDKTKATKPESKSNKNNKDLNNIDAVDHLIIYQILKIVQQQSETLRDLEESLRDIKAKLDESNKNTDTEEKPDKIIEEVASEPLEKVDDTEISIDEIIDKPIKISRVEKPAASKETEIEKVEKPATEESKATVEDERPSMDDTKPAFDDENAAIDFSKEYIYNEVDAQGYKIRCMKICNKVYEQKMGVMRAIATLVEYVLDNNLCTATDLVDKIRILHFTPGGYYRRSIYIYKYSIEITVVRCYSDFKRIVGRILGAAGLKDSDLILKFQEQA